MSVRLISSTVVIVAHHFNPSIINQLWLTRREVLGPDDFQPDCVFTDVIVNVEAREFALFVTPDQLQFAPRGDSARQRDLVTSTLGKVVESLPHTPYVAAGLNFAWHLQPERTDVKQLSRVLF